MKKLLFMLSALLIIGQNITYGGTVSFDQLATSSDLTVAKYNADLNKIFTDYNSNIQTGNIADDTLTEADMADEINPRVRTSEGASCAKVVTGLLPAVNAGSLTTTTSAGTAYPQGYRVNKSSTTQKTYTATKWTFVDLDQNGDFQYSEVAIDAATPAVATNSIRLARVSTDGTGVQTVTDLRTTSCAQGPFSAIKDTATEASLEDMFLYGQPVRRFSPAGRTPEGWANGLFVSYDTHTQFKVTKGSAYVNAEFRFTSQDETVTTANDNPAQGDNGLDTGAIAANTKYYVFAVADQSSVADLSFSYSTSGTAPTGLTNYRLIGSINTDKSALFTSNDPVTVHALSEREIVGGWINFNGSGGIASRDAYNVSAIADDGAGQYTVTWDANFLNNSYATASQCQDTGSANQCFVAIHNTTGLAAGSARLHAVDYSGGNEDSTIITLIAIGDSRR